LNRPGARLLLRGLGDQGLIFRFPDESVYVCWNTDTLNPRSDEHNWTAPFTTDEYDATTRLRCRAPRDPEFDSCQAMPDQVPAASRLRIR
jgi:hypothetical protein